MSLINKGFFIGDINIPNTNVTQVEEVLNLFIEKYEVEYLTSVLGIPLYKAFVTGMGVQTPDQKWKDLLYGCEYTALNAQLRRWKGLIEKPMYSYLTLEDGDITKEEASDVDDEDIHYRSPIALYVYYWFMRNNGTLTSGAGEVTPKNENSNVVSPAHKMARAYNEMVDWTWALIDFLESKKDTYPEWKKNSTMYFCDKLNSVNTFGI